MTYLVDIGNHAISPTELLPTLTISMPQIQFAKISPANIDAPYFSSLNDLDTWAASSSNHKLDGVLRYIARADDDVSSQRGKLLVCHDYKGGYTENTSALSYTYNFWSSCDTFVFSHHRVTVPPPGWITAAHRQGVKILGTLIFEGDGQEDCLRLLMGQLPQSVNGPAKATARFTSLPLSPHYARLLAELAYQRGFDGYLLNFECPLGGGIEQCRALAAWITLLQHELLNKVGSHGETHWYDSVIFNGQLKWQDRLNSLNLPFFLSSTAIFTNYTWPPSYPNTTAEYFLSLESVSAGSTLGSEPRTSKKSLSDIYMGVDVWGRGSHGGGGFGSYKAITHIDPGSLGLSVALFGQGWTWESEQDKPGFNWEKWWEYDRKLWVGPTSGDVEVPDVPRRRGEPECPHGPFQPITSFFPHNPPPDPLDLFFHTTFNPGVGRAWFVNGINVYQTGDGWTDIDKQCSVGDLLWPLPAVQWDDDERISPLPHVLPAICFEDAWNGGSSVRIDVSCPGSKEDTTFRSIWIPIQTLSITSGTKYGATLYYKIVETGQTDLDLGLSVKSSAPDAVSFEIQPIADTDSELPGGWSKLSIQLSIPMEQDQIAKRKSAIGLIVALLTEDPSKNLDVKIRIGQLNVYPVQPSTAAVHSHMMLCANFTAPKSKDTPGMLSWEVGVSFLPLTSINITSPDDPVSAWAVQPSNNWFPQFMYYNIYGLLHFPSGHVGQPENAVWLGTTGLVGRSTTFEVVPEELPFWSEINAGKSTKVRFYIQGVTDNGNVLEWENCVFVDSDLQSILV